MGFYSVVIDDVGPCGKDGMVVRKLAPKAVLWISFKASSDEGMGSVQLLL